MNKLTVTLACLALLTGCAASPAIPTGTAVRGAGAEAASKRATGDYAKASKWLDANSGGSFWDRPRKHLFPASDDGEGGTRAKAFGDADGHWFSGFVKAWIPQAYYLKQAGHEYNPTSDIFVVVETSDDESVLMVGLYDRQANKGHMITECEWVDMGSTVSQADFHALFPTMGNVKDADPARVSDKLWDRGVDL